MRDGNAIQDLLRQALETKLDVARNLATSIRGLDDTGAGTWQEAVRCAMEVGVSDELFERELHCTRLTLIRWISGQAEPQGQLRANMRETLARMVDDVARRSLARLSGMRPEEDAPRPPGP